MILLDHSSMAATISAGIRPCVRGKFLFLGDQKLYLRGVTYGTFRPREDGDEYPDPEVVEHDFALMAANGLNAVRTYTVPSRWLLDAAQRHGLWVMVGLPVERYVGYLTDKKKGAPDIRALVRSWVRACADHPAVLCYAIGNEIPASIVRWHGRHRLERYLKRLYQTAKAEDPDALVTYVNYPSSEYLQLPFLDFLCFNVYLEEQTCLAAYLARLHNLAGDRPLVMSELGLDSRRHGEDCQARTLDWQVRTAFAAGCAGAFVYAWTDEWYRGGAEVDDWDFGLVRRDRCPKPALAAVRAAFAEVPFRRDLPWPRMSVVVCSYNGARTIRDCLGGLRNLEYPDFEVIVVDDGSRDGTAAIASEYPVRLIQTRQRGLSHARNTGLAAATGEIVAYLDDDASPDPHWLTYLAATFLSTAHVGVGGPNIAPSGAGLIADCVAAAPGGPAHVLLSDHEAEHLPGCNMAFRKTCLEAIGGFDPQFRVAGDDVDVCWRLRQHGWTLGFSPAAMVWHRPRISIRAYWKQQRGYGKAEALLERQWPEKYNRAGQITWTGHVYERAHPLLFGRAGRIYHGIWGSAPFQPLYQPAPGLLRSLPLMPEWHLVSGGLAVLAALGILWTPLLLALPPLVLAVGTSLVQASLGAAQASVTSARRSRGTQLTMRLLTAFLHLLQPLARLHGRLHYGLTPWRRHATLDAALPRPRRSAIWTDQWQAPETRLQAITTALRAEGAAVLHGSAYDRWDLEVQGGMLGAARTLMATEEHGGGRQFVRFHSWPRCTPGGLVLIGLSAALATGAALAQAWAAAGVLGLLAILLGLRMLQECAAATGALLRAFRNDPQERRTRYTDLALYRRLLRQARPYWPHIGAIFLLSLLSSPLALLAPLPLKIAIDSAVGSHPLPGFLDDLLPAAIARSRSVMLVLAAGLVVVIALLRQLQEFGSSLLRTYTSEKLVLAFRAQLFQHVQHLSLVYHDSQGPADATYRIQHDAPAIQYIAIDGIIPFISAGVTVAGMIYVTTQLDWQLALVALAVSPILLLLLGVYRRRLRQQSRQVKKLESSALSVVQEVLGAVRVVKAFGQEDHEQERFIRHSSHGMRARLGLAVVESGFGFLISLTTAVGTAAVLLIGIGHVQSGLLTLGELLLVLGYLLQLYDPLKSMGKQAARLQSHLASAERALSLLDEAPEVAERPHARLLARASGALAFRQVSFAYEPGRPVLHDLTLDIAPGTRMGIVGATGAGKTTLVSLLTRFYDPSAGQILLDGVDLRDYKLADLRNQFGIVLQEPVLFSTSIAENIAYARPGASEEEIVAAATAANAHEFIVRLPQGYATPVGERGMFLSGGERQRIALARAFLKDAPILILDEPTSAIDIRTEATIIEAMERLMHGRTTFIIAHRLSALERCDARIELEQGRISATSPGSSTRPECGLAALHPGPVSSDGGGSAPSRGSANESAVKRRDPHSKRRAHGRRA